MNFVVDLTDDKTPNEPPKKKRGRPKKVRPSGSIEIVDLTEEKTPKKKRGRPKRENNVKDALIQTKLERLKKDVDERLLFTDQNLKEFLMYGDITAPKKRGRPKKLKLGFTNKNHCTELIEVVVPALNQLCPSKASFEKIDYPCENMENVSDTAGILNPVQLCVSAANSVSKSEEEPTKKRIEDVKVSDNCASTRVLCCSVRLKILEKDELQKHLNCSMDVEEPEDKTLEKQSLLDNLGNFLRYKGSSTRGNFLNNGLYDSPNSWCFKFSDDSCDEDYHPNKQVINKKKNKLFIDDLDWSPAVKKVRRKTTKNFPANAKARRVKGNEMDQVSTKSNYSSIDSLSGTSVDNSFTGTHDSSSEFDPLTNTCRNVNLSQTSGCSPTNLTEKNRSSMKHAPRMMPESKVVQSPIDFRAKRKFTELQVSQTSTCASKKTIEIIDISSDISPDDESITSDPSSNLTNTNLQINPLNIEPDTSTLNACASKSKRLLNSSCASNDSERVVDGSANSGQTLEKHEHYLMSEITAGRWKQGKYSKQQVSQTTWDSCFQLVPMRNNSQLRTESIETKSPCDANIKHSKDEIPQLRNSAANSLPTGIRDISGDSSSLKAPMKGNSKFTTFNARKFRNIQNTLQSILKQKIHPKRQQSQTCGLTSNLLTDASGSDVLQTVSNKQDSQLVPEAHVAKLSNVSGDEKSQTRNCATNELAGIDNVLEENSSQIALMSSDSMPETISAESLSTAKGWQAKEAMAMEEYSAEHQEDDPFERRSPELNSLISRSEEKVEHSSNRLPSHTFDVSDIVHCSSISSNFNDENASAEHCSVGCTYCTIFAELDAITILAEADFGDDPKAYLEWQIESTEAMCDKLKAEQPHDDEIDLKLKKMAHKNTSLKYGRDFLSSFGSFIKVSDHFLKSIDLEIA